MPRILLIEDEPAIADNVVYALGTEGFDTIHAGLASQGLALLRADTFDLVLLDVGLPDANGFDVFRALREFSPVPVIFLTARAGEIDRIVGLEIGADDYVIKPFSPRELAARVRAVLRRSKRGVPTGAGRVAPDGGLRIDADGARAWFGGRALDLTRYEFLLLKVLAAQPERIYSRDQLMDLVWNAPDHSLDRTVDTHIKTLRAKLRAAGAGPDPIRTHRGLGYSYGTAA